MSLPNTKPSSVFLTIGLFAAGIARIVLLQHSLPARPSVKPVAALAIPKPTPVPLPILLFNVDEIVGRYYLGDGLGVNCTLEIRRDHQFLFRWTGCEGVYDTNAGAWELQGDVLVCKPDSPNKQEGFAGMNLRFVPVQWGKRYYLIDENEMPAFCAAAASGGVSDILDPHGEDYLKQEEDGKLPPLQGAPLLPERYRTFYNRGAIKARVVAIDKIGHIVLHEGRAERLEPGMLLTTDTYGKGDVKILSVAEHTALAEAHYLWNSDHRLKVGDELTTGGYWHRPGGTKLKVYHNLPR